MTDERKQDVLLVALILSLVAHVALMLYVKPKVMTHISRGPARVGRYEPMRVRPENAAAEPLSLAEIEDVKATREELPVNAAELAVPGSSPIVADRLEVKAPDASVPAHELPAPERALFAAEPVKLDTRVTERIPVAPLETPKFAAAPAAPSVAPATPGARPSGATATGPVPTVPVAAAVLPKPDEEVIEVRLPAFEDDEDAFEPPAEVLERVEEKIVEQEKKAVRKLVDANDAAELADAVKVALAAETEGAWTYFRVAVSPKAVLPTVPKDVVVILDASGSIGTERMGSIRGAAKKILRSAANTGDRFNLVAFRDRYSYAFRRWQDCTVESFAAADRWLNNVAPFGRTDVFATISSVLTLPRDPKRPLIALVVTDGEANTGVSDTHEILARFTALNDGLISVYMYGVKSSANRELIDLLTHGNRGESFVFEGARWRAGAGIEALSERFRDPVLSDLRLVFASDLGAEAYPCVLRNLYRGGTLEITGRVPSGRHAVAFSLRGLNGRDAYEGFFTLPLKDAAPVVGLSKAWRAERDIASKLK